MIKEEEGTKIWLRFQPAMVTGVVNNLNSLIYWPIDNNTLAYTSIVRIPMNTCKPKSQHMQKLKIFSRQMIITLVTWAERKCAL